MKELLSVPIEGWIVILAIVFFLGLVAFIGFAAFIVKSLRTLQGSPEKRLITNQPLQVQEYEQFATKTEVAELNHFVGSVDHDLKSLRREIVANGESRRLSIESKVENARGEAQAHIESVRKELAEDINNMPARIISMLRQTKDLL